MCVAGRGAPHPGPGQGGAGPGQGGPGPGPVAMQPGPAVQQYGGSIQGPPVAQVLGFTRLFIAFPSRLTELCLFHILLVLFCLLLC